MKHFSEHGTFALKRTGPILVVDAVGPFNRETNELLERQLDSHIQAFAGQDWAEIALLHRESAYTPDALTQLHHSMCTRSESAMRAIAIVFIDTLSRSLTTHQMNQVLNSIPGLAFAYFDNQDEAQTWCQQQLKMA